MYNYIKGNCEMDILGEIFLEIYMELMMLIIPEKNISKKHKLVAKIIAIVVLLAVLSLVVWGIVLIVDYSNLLGIIPLTIAITISLIQIILGIILYKKHH